MPATQFTSTLDDYLTVVSKYVPAALIDESSLGQIRQRVGTLPAALTQVFGFECLLTAGRFQSDFQFAIAAGSECLFVLTGRHDDIVLPASWQLLHGSQQMERFARIWSEMPPQHLPAVILGVDCDASEQNRSGLLFHLRTEKRTAEEVLALLPIATGHAVPKQMKSCLERCLSQCIPVFVGFMYGRSSDGLRLTQRLTIPEVIPYLDAIVWPGERSRVVALLSTIEDWTTHVALSLNVGSCVQPYLGIELLNWTKPGSPQNVWRTCMATLVEQNLCAPEKHDAVFAWQGMSHAKLETWPSSLQASVAADDALPVLIRKLSHLKLVLRPDNPLEAKAYLEVRRSNLRTPMTDDTSVQISHESRGNP